MFEDDQDELIRVEFRQRNSAAGTGGVARRSGMARLRCWPICGPKCSIFMLVVALAQLYSPKMLVSIVGVIFLGLLGAAFYMRSYMLFEELAHYEWKNITVAGIDDMINTYNSRYTSAAYNCWIAAALYVVTFVFTFWQNTYNPGLC